MKDLRIIFVSWNNERTLEACLKSLSSACSGLDWEAIIIDNASTDKSIEIVQKIINDQSRIKLISNKENRGFSKACNQGLVDLDARYVLLLNPDTECPAGSLIALVKDADAHPKAGIIAPKLLNTDGTVQAGIRRFPNVWNQVGVMLKLHNIFPGLFRQYFASDISLEHEQEVDQVMGACFLIRREVIEQIGGLDERYFVWFEEVDYCRMAKEKGWIVRYAPSVHVTHHGGESFRQAFALTKQKYFNNSLISYFQKWEPEWKSILLRMISPLSLVFAWIVGMVGLAGQGSRAVLAREEEKMTQDGVMKSVGRWFLVVIVLELISGLTIFNDAGNAIATMLAGVIIAYLAYKRPTLALAVIALELLIGSQGRLLQWWGWPGILSLRMALFGGFFVGWIIHRIHDGSDNQENRLDLWRLIRDRIEWVLLAAIVAYGVVRGELLGNGPIMADANAWVFMLLVIPVIDIAMREGERLKRDVLPVLIVGPIWAAFKALGLEYLFTHGLAIVDPPSAVYLWVRRTGVGEITPLSGGLHRVFFQSFIFALPILFIGLSYYFATQGKGLKERIALFRKPGGGWSQYGDVMLIAACTMLLLSLSRSLWIGAIGGTMVLLVIYLYRRVWKNIFQVVARFALIGIETIALMMIFVAFPLPQPDIAGWGDAVSSRVSTNEAAAVSRWQLLPVMMGRISEHALLGSGFGATITYKSQDPRVLAHHPSGDYTTYAFEWGWLDFWLKLGILGPLVMIFLLYRLGRRLLRTDAPDYLRYGTLASLVGLAIVHVFTPYLNHPLGLGYLMMLEGYAELFKMRSQATK